MHVVENHHLVRETCMQAAATPRSGYDSAQPFLLIRQYLSIQTQIDEMTWRPGLILPACGTLPAVVLLLRALGPRERSEVISEPSTHVAGWSEQGTVERAYSRSRFGGNLALRARADHYYSRLSLDSLVFALLVRIPQIPRVYFLQRTRIPGHSSGYY
jgi:hypothetical protein